MLGVVNYIFRHKTNKDIKNKRFTIEKVESGESKIYIESMKENGYELIGRKAERSYMIRD